MSQPELLEAPTVVDDWGDFSPVLDQLAQEESPEAEAPEEEDKTEALEGLLSVVFMITEQATSMIAGVDFQFDPQGKQHVIDAASPVFEKHGGKLMGVFGDYIEEATLIMALLALVYSARQEISQQKAIALQKKQAEQAQKERERRERHGQEAATVSPA